MKQLLPKKGKKRLLSMIEEGQIGVFLDKEFGGVPLPIFHK